MKKILVYSISIVLLTLSALKGHAQESMMNEIDYPFLQKLIISAKQNYPVYKIKQEQVVSARTSFNESKYAWFDALTFSYIYNPNNTTTLTTNNAVGAPATGSTINPNLTYGYTAGITLNIGTLIKNPFNTKIAKSNYNIALLEQQVSDATVETQVRRLYIAFVEAQATSRMRTQNAQDVNTMFTQARHKFEENTIAVDVYATAITALAAANQTKINAEALALTTKIALEEIVGKKLEEIK